MQWVIDYMYINELQINNIYKKPSSKKETQVQSLGQEDPLKKEMATDSSILAWEIP